MATQPLILGSEVAKRIFRAGRSDSLASHVVAEVRDSLFAGRLAPGDFLGTEKDIAARFGVSRIVARDALRSLEALGIAQIKMGKGGGARIAAGNPSLFAEALAVQLHLTGVSAAEIMDAQRAAECMAAELAAEHATAAEHARLEALLVDAAAKTTDTAAFTLSCRDFHLAIAEASHNRVLVVQLASLQYVSWPKDNRQVTPKLVKHILDIHHELAGLIQLRDGAAARRLMDEHVRMIRARRVARPERAAAQTGTGCC
ncbi:MAG TPA: FCD domain-containing protein [Caldimonas sp.]|nr:FCD domain-containing protein [Caldimonas sp.]